MRAVRPLSRIPALRRLPMLAARSRRDVVLFESWHGRYSDNPRGVSEELQRQSRGFEQLWVARPEVELPGGVSRVVPGSVDYLRALGSARTIVTNNTLPGYFRKRRGTFYLQSWHGTPLKRIAFDIANERFRREHGRYLDHLRREVASWDALVSPNRFSTDVLRTAFRYDGPILETGYPRTDLLVAPEGAARREAVRAELGLGPGELCVLYAPTWRDTAEFSLRLDLDEYARALPDSVLVLRAHPLVANEVDLSGHARVRDESEREDIRDLLLAADVLITDYSSVMFDFAVTGKPIVLFTYDLESYRDDLRGFYFDLEREAPGPMPATGDEVIEVLRSLDTVSAEHAVAYERFRARFCDLDDGHAARRVIEALPLG